jgi:hypothetical protein
MLSIQDGELLGLAHKHRRSWHGERRCLARGALSEQRLVPSLMSRRCMVRFGLRLGEAFRASSVQRPCPNVWPHSTHFNPSF